VKAVALYYKLWFFFFFFLSEGGGGGERKPAAACLIIANYQLVSVVYSSIVMLIPENMKGQTKERLGM